MKKCVCVIFTLLFSLVSGRVNADAVDLVYIEGLVDQYIATKVMGEVYMRADIDVTFTALPGSRALKEASEGTRDGETMRVYSLGDRVKTLLRVPTPIMSLQTAVFARKDNNVIVNTEEDLTNYRIAVVRGVLHTEPYQQSLPDVHVLNDQNTLFKFVDNGRADALITNRVDGRAAIASGGYTEMQLINAELKKTTLHHYLHNSRADILPTLEEIMKAMSDSGELTALVQEIEDEYILSITKN